MTQNAKRYTSVSKGGEFEIVGTSSGAGQRKGDVVIVYRNVETGQVLHREPEDFAMRMKQAPALNGLTIADMQNAGILPKTDVQSLLLAALEGADKAITAALPHLPADGEAVFCGEWLEEIREAIAAAKGAV